MCFHTLGGGGSWRCGKIHTFFFEGFPNLSIMVLGEVNVEHALLKEFLQVGEDLRVEGLCEKVGSGVVQNPKIMSNDPVQEQKRVVTGSAAGQVKVENKKEEIVQSPAPISKQREKTERKRERMEKKKRKVSSSNERIDTNTTIVKKNRKKENFEKHSIEAVVAPALIPEPETIVNDNKFAVYELGDSSEENENFSLRENKDCRTPRKKAKKSFEELKDEAINRDVLTMDPGEAHGILKLVENLETIEENSEDLNVFVRLLNQLILKSDIASNVLFFCGICQKSLKSKPHMLNHIESSHVNGVYHKCSDCAIKFKTRGSLSSHKVKIHKQLKKDEMKSDLDTKVDSVKVHGELDISFNESNSECFENSNNLSDSEENSSGGEFE